MFVASQELCFKLTASTYEEVDILATNQEEADTPLFLHAQYAALTHQSLVILADDTDVFIISLELSSPINNNMYFRHSTKSHVRMIDISRLATVLGGERCSVLPGLHAWTEYDTVSSLANQGER